MVLTGVLGNPLMILPPITFMQKYLHRIPLWVAVFFTAFISLGFFLALGALQGDIRQVEPVNSAGQSMKTIFTDLIVASAVSGIILWLDNLLTDSKEIHEQDSDGRIRKEEK
jgi:hypothetical protein